MSKLRHKIIRASLDALYYTGAHRMLRPAFAGDGMIFTMHHVRPASNEPFQPNRHLEIGPEFLRATVEHVRGAGIQIVSMDELHRRVNQGEAGHQFACFTFDDGYRDIRDFAQAVMREYDAPFTVYVTTDFAEGSGRIWWIALERIVRKANALEVEIDGIATIIDTSTLEAKKAAFEKLGIWLRTLPSDHEVQNEVSRLCKKHGVDGDGICRELCMSWDELKSFSEDPLVTIGAHTVSHCHLASEAEEIAEQEMLISRERIETKLQQPVAHFAYPYGDKAAASSREYALAAVAGFKTAVTTQPGMIFADNAEHLTSLPRISLNGHYQDQRSLEVLTSGLATALWNGFRRVRAA